MPDIVTYDELTPEQNIQAIALHTMAFGGSYDAESVRVMREMSGSFSDYYGLFAVEEGTVLGQVIVLRINYTFHELGRVKVAGLAGVATRTDRARRGVARAIIRAVHEREMEEGTRHAILFTNMSWHSHDLYLDLGYRDIFTSPLASRALGDEDSQRTDYSFSVALETDLNRMAEMHSAASTGGTGFVTRERGMLPALVKTGGVDLRNLHMIRDEGKAVGYADVEKTGGVQICREFIVQPGYSSEEALASMESMPSRGSVMLLRDVLTPSSGRWYAERGYRVYPSTWKVLMGLKLGSSLDTTGAVKEFGTDREDFRCQGGDNF